jgi:hypothetical protein
MGGVIQFSGSFAPKLSINYTAVKIQLIIYHLQAWPKPFWIKIQVSSAIFPKDKRWIARWKSLVLWKSSNLLFFLINFIDFIITSGELGLWLYFESDDTLC